VADGWVARRWNLVTDTGAMVDGLADKVLATSVVASLLVWHRLTGLEALLLATREILELPLLVWIALGRKQRRRPHHSNMANRSGKIATMLQLASISAALVGHRATLPLAAAAGLVGAFAGVRYASRALEENRRAVGEASTESA
jgi:phosphatidylglycerophosphate synthase